MSKVKSGFPRKFKTMQNMVKAFVQMPQVMAYDLLEELVTIDLNGEPINRISGDLANSFGLRLLAIDKWALMQISSQAPYAQRVMVNVAQARQGMAVMTALRERRYPVYAKAIHDEFLKMVADANNGRIYTWNPRKFITA